MPRIAEIKELDGQVWVRLEMEPNSGQITLMTQKELEDLRIGGARDFLLDLWGLWRAKQ